METTNKKPVWKRWWFWIAGGFFFLMLIGALNPAKPSDTASTAQTSSAGAATNTGANSGVQAPAEEPMAADQTQPAKKDFNQLAADRFKDILTASPELASIECENNDCGSGIVYFNYKTTPPTDVESVIRGNTATFSVFKAKNTSTTHVMVTARYNGADVFWCTGSKGVVDECSQ